MWADSINDQLGPECLGGPAGVVGHAAFIIIFEKLLSLTEKDFFHAFENANQMDLP